MSLLTTTDLGHDFGPDTILNGLSLELPADARVGLVGPNGAGKTTLLRILAADLEPERGQVHLARGTTVGYLRQEAATAFRRPERALYDAMLVPFEHLLDWEQELRQMEQKLDGGEAALLERYGALQQRFEEAGGYQYETRIRQVLSGLGFDRSEWRSPILRLSGGQKTRALLARLLLEAPDLLILDEPTNHLDLNAVEWLEETLRGWPGAMLVVSHDRYFLDRVVNRIWELNAGHLELYRGSYSAYLEQREARWQRAREQYDSEMERLAKELDFIRRHIAGQNTDIAKGKLKRLGRDLLAIEAFGIGGADGRRWSELGLRKSRSMTVAEAAERIGAIRPPGHPPRINVRLPAPARSGEFVLKCRDLVVGYPGAPLFTSGDLALARGATAALIGGNGTGKTTFLRTVLGDLPPLQGTVDLGVNLSVGYFSQTHERLDPTHTVLQALLAAHPIRLDAARHHLARYLFRGDEIERPVGALSGGERGRLALAILALDGANFLLLDEPTNHLDIPSQEVLQAALEAFDGTILLVSHDRYLVEHLASEIWWLDGERLHHFDGPYADFLLWRAGRNRRNEDEEPQEVDPRRQRERPALSRNEQRRRERGLAALEAEIEELENESVRATRALQQASEAEDYEALQAATAHFEATQSALTAKLAAWEHAAAELDALLEEPAR